MSLDQQAQLSYEQILYSDPSTWIWPIERIEEWLSGFPQDTENLALAFISLKRWLTEHVDKADIRDRSLILTHRFIEALNNWLREGELTREELRLAFGIVTT